jgi:GDP-L-fucose synthase
LGIAAARVGGSGANLSDPLGFISDNLEIQTNLMLAAANAEVEKIVFLGSSCVYPRLADQPIIESRLLSGYLEETNQPYAIAKISGIELLNAINKEYGTTHFTIMPCNLFGQNDNYSEGNSHVLPAMIRKFHDAKINNTKSLSLWGTGSPMREFMHADDFADALIHSVFKYQSGGLLNIGSGKEISILNLAQTIANVIGFEGEITWDS